MEEETWKKQFYQLYEERGHCCFLSTAESLSVLCNLRVESVKARHKKNVDIATPGKPFKINDIWQESGHADVLKLNIGRQCLIMD
jgi:hypothetical protein